MFFFVYCRKEDTEMQIPTQKECFQYISQMEMMDHIVSHSIQVCRVALLLVDALNQGGVPLSRNLVQAAALLHDITKTRSFKTNENHAVTAGEWLTCQGYPEVGAIVRQHVQLDTYSNSNIPTEVEVVNYADKRVLHDKIVPLSERMNYILIRYGKERPYRRRIRNVWKKTEGLERKIFNRISFAPQEVDQHANQHPFSHEL